MKARAAAALVVLVTAALLVACGSGGAQQVGVGTNPPAASPSPATPALYGSGQTIHTDTGAVKVTVARPELVTVHTSAYDPHAEGLRSPAPTATVMVRVLVTVDGVSGRVPPVEVPTAGVYLSYESAGAQLPAQPPGSLFEDVKPLSVAARSVPVGNRASGYLYFQATDATGRVVAAIAGALDAPPVAVWQGRSGG